MRDENPRGIWERSASIASARAMDVSQIYKEIRSGWPIVCYQPNPKQEAFHYSNAISRFLLGGNQSGKTHAGNADDESVSCGFRPWLDRDDPNFIVRDGRGRPVKVPNTVIVTVEDFPNHLSRSWWPKFVELTPPSWYTFDRNPQGFPVHVNWIWGSETWILSRKSDDASFEAGTTHRVHHDEPPRKQIRTALLRGLIRHAGSEIFTCTPLKEAWMLEELMDQEGVPGYEVFYIDGEDNLEENGGVLHRATWEHFLNTLSAEERAMRKSGNWRLGIKYCVPDFQNREPWVVPSFQLDSSWRCIALVDPHEQKPDCVLGLAMHLHEPRWVVFAETMDHRTHGSTGKTVARVRMMGREANVHIGFGIIDPRAGERTPREQKLTVQARFAQQGLPLAKAPGISRESGYKALNELFKFQPGRNAPQLQVMAHCEKTISELRRLQWVRDPKSTELKLKTAGPDDHASCLRYAASVGPTLLYLGAEVTDAQMSEDYEDDAPEPGEWVSGASTGY